MVFVNSGVTIQLTHKAYTKKATPKGGFLEMVKSGLEAIVFEKFAIGAVTGGMF